MKAPKVYHEIRSQASDSSRSKPLARKSLKMLPMKPTLAGHSEAKPDISITLAGRAPTCLFSDLPSELLEAIVEQCILTNPSGLLSCNKTLHSYGVACLYKVVHIKSLDQLRSFVSARSGARKWCRVFTQVLRIDIPGVPGSSEASSSSSSELCHPILHGTNAEPAESAKFVGVPQTPSAKRLLYITQALELCPHIKHLHLALFTVHHSEHRISSEYRNRESNDFSRAISNLGSLETILWTPPAAAAKVQGFSVAIVEQVLQSLAQGIRAAAFAAARIRSLVLQNKVMSESSLLTYLREHDSTINVATWSDEAILGAAEGNGHPLRYIEMHNAIFTTAMGPPNLLFTLAAAASEPWTNGRVVPKAPIPGGHRIGSNADRTYQTLQFPHPCEALFPNLTAVRISSATNISAQGVSEMLCKVGRTKSLSIEITNGFLASIWEARLTRDKISSENIPRLNELLKRHLLNLSRRWVLQVRNAANPFRQLVRLEGFSARILRGWWLTGRPSSVWPFVDLFWQVYIPIYLLFCASKSKLGYCYGSTSPYAQAWLQALTSQAEGSDEDLSHMLPHNLDFDDVEGARSSLRQIQHHVESRDSPVFKNTPPNLDRWRASLAGDERYKGRVGVTVEEWMDDRIEVLLEQRMQGLKLYTNLDRIGGGHSRADARGIGW